MRRVDRQGSPEHWTPLRFSARNTLSKITSPRSLSSIAATLLTLASIATPVTTGVTTMQKAQVAHDKRIAATTQLSESTGLHHDQLSIYPKLVSARIDAAAAKVLASAQHIAQQDAAKTDTKPLVAAIDALKAYPNLGDDRVQSLTTAAQKAADAVTSAAAAHDRQVAAALAAANTPDGARATARSLAASLHGWGDGEFQCLSNLWAKESGWNYQSYNASSGAGGIPQALPASKMASAGSDWASSAATQIKWGLDYIARGYGSPCAAWSHSQSMNWY